MGDLLRRSIAALVGIKQASETPGASPWQGTLTARSRPHQGERDKCPPAYRSSSVLADNIAPGSVRAAEGAPLSAILAPAGKPLREACVFWAIQPCCLDNSEIHCDSNLERVGVHEILRNSYEVFSRLQLWPWC